MVKNLDTEKKNLVLGVQFLEDQLQQAQELQERIKKAHSAERASDAQKFEKQMKDLQEKISKNSGALGARLKELSAYAQELEKQRDQFARTLWNRNATLVVSATGIALYAYREQIREALVSAWGSTVQAAYAVSTWLRPDSADEVGE